MEKRIQAGLTLAVSTLLLLASAACQKSEKGDIITVQSPVKVNDEALKAEVEAAKDKLAEQKRALVAESEEKLKRLDAKLEALKTSAAARSEEAKAAGEATLSELARQRDEARAALAKAEGATRDSWESLKTRAVEARDQAERAYNDALEKLKSD